MTMRTRNDGSEYPDTAAEEAFLRHETDPNAEHLNARTVGDLIVDVLAPAMVAGTPEYPEEWESLEHSMLETSALELRALMCALNESSTFEDGMGGDVLSNQQTVRILRAISKRMESGAELCRRLRCARWGNPHFGGGEAMATAAREAREAFEQDARAGASTVLLHPKARVKKQAE